MLLDPYMSGEKYIEDCQVCCNPIEIELIASGDKLISFSAVKLQ
jgi:hypothetical protein